VGDRSDELRAARITQSSEAQSGECARHMQLLLTASQQVLLYVRAVGGAERAGSQYERRCRWKPMFMRVPAQSSWRNFHAWRLRLSAQAAEAEKPCTLPRRLLLLARVVVHQYRHNGHRRIKILDDLLLLIEGLYSLFLIAWDDLTACPFLICNFQPCSQQIVQLQALLRPPRDR
jgi:hypothetical protein